VLDTASHARLLDRLAPFPDIVVVVVGLLGDQAISARDPAAAETVMRTNYVGPALLLGEIANRMEARGGGTIVALSSVAGERGRASNYVYGSGKAGLTAFLSGLRNRLAATGVRVVTVKPGFVATRMTEGMKLPALLTVRPDAVADAVLGAVERRRDIVYVGRVWAIIMAIIRLLPEPVFKRTRL
jgi:short-subunit dehydrogenase